MEVDVTSCYFYDVIFVIKENKLCRYFFLEMLANGFSF